MGERPAARPWLTAVKDAVRLSLENYEKFDIEDGGGEPDDIRLQNDKRPKERLAYPRSAARFIDPEADKPKVPPIYDRAAELRERRQRREYYGARIGTLAYIVSVAVGCFSFQFWGCFCMHEWGECVNFPVPRLVGVGWCCGIGGAVAANLYVTVPMMLWVKLMYRWTLALRLGVHGALLGTGFAFLLALGLQGKDPPPGFGISGVPIGSAIFAGLCTWVLHSACVYLGYRYNKRLGFVCSMAVTYLIVCTGVGTLAAFELHLGVGIGVCLTLLFVMGWTAQVWVTTLKKRLTVLAYLAPIAIGAGFGVPVEFMPDRFGMPETSGYAIACGICALSVVALSHVFETRGIAGAQNLAVLLIIQDAIGLACWVAGYNLTWASGMVMAFALELMLLAGIHIGMREGNQFGLWQALYPMVLLLIFSPLLVVLYQQTWEAAIVVGSAASLGVGFLVYLGFRRFGVVGGMRAIFITLLCTVQVQFMMLEFLVVQMPGPLAIGFGSVAFLLLLGSLIVGLRSDDGSGRLYGSGVEVLGFVMTSQFFCYFAGLMLYGVVGATDVNAHFAAAVLGSLVLVCPTITRSMAGSHANTARNFRRGLWIAVLLALLWTSAVLTLRYLFHVPTGLSVQICSGYTIVFLLFIAFAIHRFVTTLFIVYIVFLIHTVGSILLVFVWQARMGPLGVICILVFFGFGLPLPCLWPLSQQRADKREDAVLGRLAAEVREREANLRAEKAARPRNPRSKHSLKAQKLMRLEKQHNMPKLLELSHNGVMERAGLVRWCGCASDGRPILPFVPQMIVARGSFLYLFPPEGDLHPTTRAISAIPIYAASVKTIPHYFDDRLPTLKDMIHIKLEIKWKRRQTIYLQLRSEEQMRAWATDLQRRAKEDSSESYFRRDIREQAAVPDPSLAVGMLAVRKSIARAKSAQERREAERGITGFPEDLEGGTEDAFVDPSLVAAARARARGKKYKPPGQGGVVSRMFGRGRDPSTRAETAAASRPLQRSASPPNTRSASVPQQERRGGGRSASPPRRRPGGGSSMAARGRSKSPGGGRSKHSQLQRKDDATVIREAQERGEPLPELRRTRIQKVIRRARAAAMEAEQELVSTKVFNSVVMYTPRGHHGSAEDMKHNYREEIQRRPGLAASARDATQKNEAIDAEMARLKKLWLEGRGKKPEGLDEYEAAIEAKEEAKREKAEELAEMSGLPVSAWTD